MNSFALRAWIALISLVALSTGCASSSDTPDEPPTEQKQADQREQTDVDQADAFSAEDEQAPSGFDEPADAQEPDEIEDLAEASDGPAEISDRVRDKLDQAVKAAASGDRSRAVRGLQELVHSNDGGFLAAYNLGVIYENEGEYGQAVRRYSQALERHSGFSPALLNLVRLYLRMDQVNDAAKLVEKYTDKRPENMDHRAIGLQVDLERGRYDEVISKAKQILRRDETNAEAMMAMAEANLQLGRTELAEAILDRVYKLQPDRAEIFFKYSRIRLAENEDDIGEAIALLERALDLQPDYPEARNNLGVLYHEAGDHADAIEQFKAAIDSFPEYKEAYLNLGNAYKAEREFGKAEEAFTRALEIDAEYAAAYFNLGVLYLDSEKEGMETIAQLEESIDFFQDYKDVEGSGLSRDNLADKYIKEARNTIKAERQREEMRRQAQMSAEEDETEADEELDESDSEETAEESASDE